jgi:stage III sporulation protein AC
MGYITHIEKKCTVMRRVRVVDFELILKVAGVGMIVTVICQLMSKAGRDEQSTMVSLVGMVVILILLADKLGDLVRTLREVFLL